MLRTALHLRDIHCIGNGAATTALKATSGWDEIGSSGFSNFADAVDSIRVAKEFNLIDHLLRK